jgi:hypothetical protein
MFGSNERLVLVEGEDFLAPRRCMREPTNEIFHASHLLDRATDAHLAGDHSTADTLFRAANITTVRAWTESLWARKAANRGPRLPYFGNWASIAAAPTKGK